MCGIAGIVVSPDQEPLDAHLVSRMCRALVHRGPDDEGVFVKGGVGLGMRRLSIIDIAGGHQPVFNEDRSIYVVFNGEIYNHPELRRELQNRGHVFASHSDTEVIVHLYEELGANCVHKLRGMFAFAVFDDKRSRLLLARDRLGKKPLHYALMGGRFFFGSEIKALLAGEPALASETDSTALLEYFYFGYIPDPRTAFAKIKKLPPAHLLEFEKGQIRLKQYWDLPEYGTYNPSSEEQCLEELEEKLAEAVRIRLLADVPLGALLSGGTDSSTIVALMARASSRPVKTFSVGFRDAQFNEAPFARIVAEKFATDHHELVLEPKVRETIESLAYSMEEPFGDSSALPTYYISKLAREYVTVVLSGDGGDEAFAGYDRYSTHLQQRARFAFPNWGGRFYREKLYSRIPFGFPGRNYAYSLSLPTEERYVDAVSLAPYDRNYELLSSDFVGSEARHPLDLFRELMRNAPAKDVVGRVLYLDTKTYLPCDILTKVDRMSMLASLEARVPLLDHVLLEWVTSLHPRWKMAKNRRKYILEELAVRVGVPRRVIDRPKQGFALPLVHWMKRELKDLVLTLLEPATLQRGYFNARGVERLVDRFLKGYDDDPTPIWRLLMFELWYRNFVHTRDSRLPATSGNWVTQTAAQGLA